MGINRIIELPPSLASVNVVDVADALKVIEPVEFNLPSIVLFRAWATSLKCCVLSPICKGTFKN